MGEPPSGFALTELPPQCADDLALCIERARADLVPASAAEIDEAVFVISAMPSQSAEGAALDALEMLYRIGLDDMPLDLLTEGVRQAIKREPRWRPMPGMVRSYVEAELEARRVRLARLERAAAKAEAVP